MRRITALKLASQQEKNRLHSVSQSAEITPLVRKDIQSHLVQLERHVEKLEQQAEAIVQADPELAQQFRHLVSVRGFCPSQCVTHPGRVSHIGAGHDRPPMGRSCRSGSTPS